MPLLPLSDIDVAVLVGGLGSRLRGVVDDVPKPLAPVLGRPFLFYQLDMLALRGARSVTLCCGYKSDLIRQMTGIEWLGMPVRHSIETGPLGTGGALSHARELLGSEWVLVLNGDSWFEPEWAAFFAARSLPGIEGCMALVEVTDASRFGSVRLQDGRVCSFEEKSTGAGIRTINGGVYLVSQNMLAALPPAPCSLERDVFPALCRSGRLAGTVSASGFLDIGVPESYSVAGDFFTRLGIAPQEMFPDSPRMGAAVPKIGTCAVILDEAGRVVLERRSDCGWWCLPAGRLDAGETLAEGAVREAREETGLEVEITGFPGVFSDPRRRTVRYADNGDLRQLVDAVVLARPIGGRLAASPESLDVGWFAPDRIPLNTVPPVVEILRHSIGWNGRSVLR